MAVEPIPTGQATYNLWNATNVDVTITVGGGSAVLVGPGDGVAFAQVPAGTVLFTMDSAAGTFEASADSYTDVFAVDDGTGVAIAYAAIASMSDLIGSIEPPSEGAVVPDVVGLAQAEAEGIIVAEGLVAATQLESSDTVDAGLVIATDPAAGATVPFDTHIQIRVSTGIDTVEVPDVAGTAQTNAIAELEAAGLESSVEVGESETVEEGFVIETNPAAGTLVAVGTEVSVLVSSGPGDTTVPDFSGMTADEAIAAAEAVGLSADVVLDPVEPDESGFVIDQDLEAGETVPIGTVVVVQLSPAIEGPWTIIEVNPDLLLASTGVRFEPGSLTETQVLDTTLVANALVDERGYWTSDIDLSTLEPAERTVRITGTGMDGSKYSQDFVMPARGESTDEIIVTDEGFPVWGWVVAVIMLVALVLLVIVLVQDMRSRRTKSDALTHD